MFRLWKLRTMHSGAEEPQGALMARDAGAMHHGRCHGKLPRDPRITPQGRFLRCYSRDELLQLWTVDMAR